ncbi:hypothetical protein JNUCC0626_39130 [Lentzea sp. JNUCC 0626]|uniref:hypothetical protein n=1 Tax=Lentzea sp. JNUCC 0626 TaxID=3367513 RepID=UPI003749ECE7
MRGCGLCWTEAELEALDRDPVLLSDEIVRKFAWETTSHFDRDEYELAWRRLGYRVVEVLERELDNKLTAGLPWARFDSWPEGEQEALRTLITDVVVRVAGDPERRHELDRLLQAAAQLDQDMAPWLRLLDTFADDVVVEVAGTYAWDYARDNGPLLTWMWWDDPGKPIREWLVSDELRARLSTIDNRNAQSTLEDIDLMIEFSTR